MTRMLKGLGALLLLGILLVGLPWLLLRIGTHLTPQHLPDWTELQVLLLSSGGTQALLFVLTAAGWVAWAVFAVSSLAELVALVSRQRIHPRLPVLGGTTQKLAAVLIVAVVMAVIPHGAPPAAATPTAAPTPTIGHTSHASAADAQTGTPTAGPLRHAAQVGQPAVQHAPADTSKTKVKNAVAGKTVIDHRVRSGETLWSIAARYTGHGGNWREIAATNHLRNGNQISAGDHLQITVDNPGSSADDDVVTVHRGDTLTAIAEDHLGHGSDWPDIYAANRAEIRDPDLIYPGEQLRMPTTGHAEPAQHSPGNPDAKQTSSKPSTDQPETNHTEAAGPKASAPRSAQTSAGRPSAAQPSADRPSATQPGASEPRTADQPQMRAVGGALGWPVQLAIEFALTAGLLGAGVRVAMRRRRARQVWALTPGQSLPEAEPGAQLIETALTQDPIPAVHEHFGEVLKAISAHAHNTGRQLPEVVAARVSTDRIDLLLANPHLTPPAGISAINGGKNWTVDEDHLGDVLATDGIEDASQPFPSLVTVGRDNEYALVLLDLERAGLLTIDSDDPILSAELLTAVTMEMAVSPWTIDLRLVLVGDVCPGLEFALGEPTVTRHQSADEAAEMLESIAITQRCHLELAPELAGVGAAGTATGVGQIRTDPNLSEAWSPTIVIFDHQPDEAARERLTRAALTTPRVAIAVVTTTATATATGGDAWPMTKAADNPSAVQLVVDASGDIATVAPYGWSLRPQRVTDAVYSRLLDSLTTSGRTDTISDSTWWKRADQEDDHQLPPARAASASADPDDEVDLSNLAADDDLMVDESDLGDEDDQDVGTDLDGQDDDIPVDEDEDELPGKAAPAVQPRPLLSSGSLLARLTPHLSNPAVIAGDDVNTNKTPEDPDDVDDTTTDLSTNEVIPATAALVLLPKPNRTAFPQNGIPFLRLLGPVELTGQQGHRRRGSRALLELLILLLDRPGITNRQICETLCKSTHSVRSNISELRTWLGNNDTGQPFLPFAYESGRYRLLPEVTSDWRELQLLIHAGDITDITDDQLQQAGDWIRGIPLGDFAVAGRNELGWFAGLQSRIRDTTIKIQRETTRRALDSGNLTAARTANQLAIEIEPEREDILADAYRIENAAGNRAGADNIRRLITQHASEYGLDLDDDTLNVFAGPRRHR